MRFAIGVESRWVIPLIHSIQAWNEGRDDFKNKKKTYVSPCSIFFVLLSNPPFHGYYAYVTRGIKPDLILYPVFFFFIDFFPFGRKKKSSFR